MTAPDPQQTPDDRTATAGAAPAPTFREALLWWLRLGIISVGGAAGQIAMMQTELVDRRRWIEQTRFLHALNFCMLLPGPEAQQLATYLGWRLHGIAGGIAAGVLFIVPGFFLLWLLSWIAAAHGDVPVVRAIFDGVQPVVIAIIAAALYKIGKRTLTGWQPAALAVAAFVGIYVVGVPFPIIVLAAGAIGLAAAKLGSDAFGKAGDATDSGGEDVPTGGWRRLGRLSALFFVLWAVPIGLILLVFGTEPFVDIARLFTVAAFVTFGGAYAVLPYIAEAGVNTYGWLAEADMVRGLALAETTPGPTILVNQFVGFFAGWNAAVSEATALSPLLAGLVGSFLAVYATFLPCFLFIFAGGPYVELLYRNKTLAAALAAITAAVVGVIANLGVFLAEAVFWTGSEIDRLAVVLSIVFLGLLIRMNLGVHWAVLAGAAIGVAEWMLL